jgi:phosphoribosylanthranilate isomerase
MWVKICANTCVEDALMAAELGADAVGFVFAPSKRQVTPAQVGAISVAMPTGIERVGVFATDSVEEIAAAVQEAGLTAVQLHGEMDLQFARRLARLVGPSIQMIQTLHWTVNEDGDDDAESQAVVRGQLEDIAEDGGGYRVLIDAKIGTSTLGGTGRSFDWASARELIGSQALRMIVAGGLRPENVGEAVRILRPWGVDVASGVEREPGRKDYEKVRRFIENARGAA